MSEPVLQPPSLEPSKFGIPESHVGGSNGSDPASPNTPDSIILPSNLQFKIGHILDANEEFIVHQYACSGIDLDPLAQQIATANPLANPYASRKPDPSTPHRCLRYQDIPAGHIQVYPRQNMDDHSVVAFFAQYEAGPPSRNLNPDTMKMRMLWFKICLDKLQKVSELHRVAFPAGIGCGIAGGDWRDYGGMIKVFAENNREIQVAVYSNEGNEDSNSVDDGELGDVKDDGDEGSRKRKREESKEVSEAGSPMELN